MKPKKSFTLLGTAAGMVLWGLLALLLYPAWPVWFIGALLVVLACVFLKQLMSPP